MRRYAAGYAFITVALWRFATEHKYVFMVCVSCPPTINNYCCAIFRFRNFRNRYCFHSFVHCCNSCYMRERMLASFHPLPCIATQPTICASATQDVHTPLCATIPGHAPLCRLIPPSPPLLPTLIPASCQKASACCSLPQLPGGCVPPRCNTFP